MTVCLYFLAALLSGFLAVVVAVIISLGNSASDFLSLLTKKMGLGVIHPHKPVSYTFAYVLAALSVALFVGGFFQLGH